MNKTTQRVAGMATYVFFGVACLCLGFMGNTAYTERRIAQASDPDQYWGERARFFASPSFGGFIEKYVPQQTISVKRDNSVMVFRIVSTTRFIMKPDVTVIAPGAEVQVKYRNNDETGTKTALTVRLLSRSAFQ